MRALIVAAAVLATACQREAVTTPELSPSSPGDASADARATDARMTAATNGENQPPDAVFRTRPRADGTGVIAGGAAFEVTFNLCQSSDPDPGDDLHFTYDFNGDGVVDVRGHCRSTHRYEVGTYESACTPATACVSDRQPDHMACRTYQVCSQGRERDRAPSPEPTPTPGEQVFVEQTIAGGLTPFASRDAWAFTAEPGSEVTVFVDTVSSATAYWMQTCVSTSTRLPDCLRPESKDRVACSYPPPGGLGCPRKTTVLPPGSRGVYYVIVGGFRFTPSVGQYTATVRAAPGIGALSLALDNSDHPASVEP